MITIDKGSSNTVCLTLNEKITGTTPVFLFNFINDQTKEEKNFIAADTSLFPNRYNKFSITESASENLTGGTVNLRTGYYTYTIYENISASNLTPASATTVLEVGKVYVSGTDAITPSIYQ